MLRNTRARIIQKIYDNDDFLNLWNGHDFAMSGLGEKIRIKGLIKHLSKTLKYSKQRAVKGYSDRDIWSMCDFLEDLFPAMLTELKNTRHGSPGTLEDFDENGNELGTCHDKWDKILDKMIFLWREANEETCSKKNQYEQEYQNAQKEFERKYGIFGDKLRSEEDIEHEKNTGNKVIYGISKAPEYEEIWNNYIEEEKEIKKYRIECKDKAFDLMKEYFYDLWD